MRRIFLTPFVLLLLATPAAAQTTVTDSVRMEVRMYQNSGVGGNDMCGSGIYAVWPNVKQDLLGSPDRTYGYHDYTLVATEGMFVPAGYGEQENRPEANISVPEGYLGHNPHIDNAAHISNGEACARHASYIRSVLAGAWGPLNAKPFRITEWYATYSVPDGAVIALFEWEQTEGVEVAFDASFESEQSRVIDVAAPGSKRPVESYHWDFGDGTTGTGAKPTHVYDEKGEYEVTLTVTDDGRVARRTETVTVEAGRLSVTVETETPEATKDDEIELVATVTNTGAEEITDVRANRLFVYTALLPDELNVEGSQIWGLDLQPAELPEGESEEVVRASLAPGESFEVRRTYIVESVATYRLQLGDPFVPGDVHVRWQSILVTGHTLEGDEVSVTNACEEAECDNYTLITPRELQVDLQSFPAAGSRLQVGYGVYDTPSGGTNVGFGNAFGDRCRSGCIDLDLRVRDAATSEPVSDADKLTITLSAPLIGGDGVVNPAGGGGVFCYDPGGVANPICGNPLKLPKGVATGEEPQRIQYFLPGIVPGEFEEREVALTVKATANDYEGFEDDLEYTALPNLVIRRSKTLSEGDLRAIKSAGLISALTTGKLLNANYLTGIKALSDACKWITSKMPGLSGSMIKDETGIKLGSTFSETLCKKIDTAVEAGIIQKIIDEAVAEREKLWLDRDYAGANADATTFFAKLKEFNTYAALISGIPDAVNVLWVANALDMSTAGLGRSTLSIQLDPPKLNLGHSSKFVSEVSAFAGKLALANIWSHTDVSYDLRIYEVSTAHPDGYPHEAIYLHFVAEFGGDRVEHKVLVDADYDPRIWLRHSLEAREIRLDGPIDPGDTVLPAAAAKAVTDTSLALGDVIVINPSTPTAETNQIIDVETRALAKPTAFAHPAGVGVAIVGNLPVEPPPPPFTRYPFGDVPPDSATLMLYWDGQLLASSYDLQVAEDSLFEHLVLNEMAVTGTSYAAPASAEHETRFWRVRARNLVGTSDWSWEERYTLDTTTNVAAEPTPADELPEVFALSAAYPNPFNPQTTFDLDVAQADHFQVYVFDVLGRRVQTLHDSPLSAGQHRLVLEGRGLPSGVYFVRLHSETGLHATRSVTLLK